MKRLITYATIILALGATVAQATLYEFNFDAITEGGDTVTNFFAHGVGENQFRMVVDTGTEDGTADFTFYNIGDINSVLSEVFIDEGTGCSLQLVDIENDLVVGVSTNVDFVGMAHLTSPNGVEPPFATDIRVRASGAVDLYNAAIANSSSYEGAEKVTLEMSYDSSFDLLDMLENGELRVATKIQGVMYPGYDDPISEYFVANGTTYEIIPEPASLVLLVGASGLVAFIRRKFSV